MIDNRSVIGYIPYFIQRELSDLSMFDIEIYERFELNQMIISCRCKACNQILGMKIDRSSLLTLDSVISYFKSIIETLRNELTHHMCKQIQLIKMTINIKSEYIEEIEKILDI